MKSTPDLAERRAALIVVDVQKGLDDPCWGSRNNPDTEEKISDLLTYWRHAALPVFHVRHLSTEPDSPLRPGTAGSEIKDVVRSRPDEPVIEKNVNSAFIGTDLEARLRDLNVDTVVVTGLTTDHCVSTTVRMAGNLGFDTYLVSDATATFDRVGPGGKLHSADSIHEIALVELHEEFATIVTTAEILS